MCFHKQFLIVFKQLAHRARYFICHLNVSQIPHVLQRTGIRGIVPAVALLAVYSFLCPQTTGVDRPAHEKYYMACILVCLDDKSKCFCQCEENNTCEASRQFCKNLCSRICVTCDTKCLDKTVKLYGKDLI